MPRGEEQLTSSDEEEDDDGVVEEVPEEVQDLPLLPEQHHVPVHVRQSPLSGLLRLLRPGGDAPAAKRRRGRRNFTREWREDDLPPQEMPASTPKPLGMEDCRYDVDYFMKLFGQDNFDLLTEQSNTYRAAECISRNKNIPAFSEKEIRQVVGTLLYMSVVSLPSKRMYWRKSLRNNMVADVMARDRFDQIVSHLHLCDNNMQPDRDSPHYDRLYKVRQLLTNCSANYAACAEVENITSVDEQMVPFKGRLGFKVYIANKPIKRGIKIFALAGQSGYIHRFMVFGDNLPVLSDEEVESLDDGIGLSGQTVLGLLMKPELPPPGVQVFFDNYFASPTPPALLAKLGQMGIPATCTLRKDRMDKCPLKTENQLKAEGRGAMDFRLTDDGVLLLKWFDNKEVTVGSNHYSALPSPPTKSSGGTRRRRCTSTSLARPSLEPTTKAWVGSTAATKSWPITGNKMLIFNDFLSTFISFFYPDFISFFYPILFSFYPVLFSFLFNFI